MFKLILQDRNGHALNMGDIVRVSLRGEFTFYSEVKYLEPEKKIAPFHTFSFHSFEKVDKVPEDAILSSETRYNIWYLKYPIADENAEQFEQYLLDWRTCEHELDKGSYRIELIK